MNGAQRRGSVLACLLLLAGVVPALAQVSTGEIFGKATDGTGAVLPGVTVTLSGSALIQPQVADHHRKRRISIPAHPHRHLHGGVRAHRLQENDPRRRGHPGRLQRRDRHEDGHLHRPGNRDGERREPGGRHPIDGNLGELQQGSARQDPVGARSVGHPRADAGRPHERIERRRQSLGSADVVQRDGQQQQPAVEHRWRRDQRHRVGQLVSHLLRLRLVRRDPDHDRRQRRVAAGRRRPDQLRDQERRQQAARLRPFLRHQREVRGQQHHRHAARPRGDRRQPDPGHQGLWRRDRRTHQEEQGLVLGRDVEQHDPCGRGEFLRYLDADLPDGGQQRLDQGQRRVSVPGQGSVGLLQDRRDGADQLQRQAPVPGEHVEQVDIHRHRRHQDAQRARRRRLPSADYDAAAGWSDDFLPR